VIENVKHFPSSENPVDVVKDLKIMKGVCFNRALLLQKIMLMNGFQIRPIYIYYHEKRDTKWFDFLMPHISSHAIFEFKFKGRWFVMRTNTRGNKLESIDDYFMSNTIVTPHHAKYLRFVSNRNCRFIDPNWVPDIYGFFNFLKLLGH
jgi:hypothetical protein